MTGPPSSSLIASAAMASTGAATRPISVLLPEPEGPTRAVEVPGLATNEMPLSTGFPVLYSKLTSRNSTCPSTAGSGWRAFSPSSSGTSLRISRMRSSPAKASVIWLPMLTICTTGPINMPRYMVNEKKPPTVMRPASTSLAPTPMMVTPMPPSSRVEAPVMAERPVMVLATLRYSRCAPLVKTRASRRSARYAFTTLTPENDSVRRPDSSALITERSRNSGRRVEKAYFMTSAKREITAKAMSVSLTLR